MNCDGKLLAFRLFKGSYQKFKNFALESGDLPKIVKKKVVQDTLKGQFTPAAINQFFKPKRTEGTGSRIGKPAITRSKMFSDQDFVKAMPIITSLMS